MGKVLGLGYIRKRGEITIPKEVREYLHLKEGDSILLILEHGQIVMKHGDADIPFN